MQARLAYIGRALRVRQHFLAQAFELAPADVLQIHPVGPARGRLIEVDRDLEAPPDLFPHPFGEAGAFLQRDAFHRDERNHVSGPDARVNPGVKIQIDQLDRFPDRPQGCLADGFRRTGKRQHRAIVVRVQFLIQKHHCGDRAHGFRQRIHLLRIAPLGKIRHALD